ncbi:MAG: hypothetical protein R2853_15180 [Thermomicrobiales bacterium]
MATGQVRCIHPEQAFASLPGLDEAGAARLYGLGVGDYRAIRRRLDTAARQAAQRVPAVPGLVARVDRLPFRAQTTVVGIGDSFTDDPQSWLESVRPVRTLRRPRDQIKVVNAAVSARTFTGALCSAVPPSACGLTGVSA